MLKILIYPFKEPINKVLLEGITASIISSVLNLKVFKALGLIIENKYTLFVLVIAIM